MNKFKSKKFRKNYYIIHSYPNDKCSMKRSGKTFTITCEKATLYYENENEEKKNYKFEFKAPNDAQADSWFDTIKANANGMKML